MVVAKAAVLSTASVSTKEQSRLWPGAHGNPTFLLLEVAPETAASGMSTVAPASMVWTLSQISSLMFAPNYKELVSSHGYSHDNVVIWKYPSLTKVAELNGHEDRILNIAMSPDCSIIATIAGDETVRFWKSFELDPVKKKHMR